MELYRFSCCGVGCKIIPFFCCTTTCRGDNVTLLHEILTTPASLNKLGGEVCQAYLDRLNGWLDNLLVSLPEQYISLCKKEAARVSSRMFLHSLIKFYQENKRSKFSANGNAQVLDDMRVMSMWLMELFENVSDVVDEQQLFLVLDGFIRCEQGDILQMYALSLQTFGVKYALELYDLLRLSLKIRSDCTDKTRKGMLALCAEFHSQLQNAIAADSNLLGGVQRKRAAFVSVFNDLCPKIGVEHCTGTHDRHKRPLSCYRLDRINIRVRLYSHLNLNSYFLLLIYCRQEVEYRTYEGSSGCTHSHSPIRHRNMHRCKEKRA